MSAEKLFFKIGEACRRLDIQPYVLRYWETEFSALAPSKSKSGQRVYSDEDLAIIARIKELLYDEGYTIAGAKKKLEGELAAGGGKLAPRAEKKKGEKAPAEAKTAEAKGTTKKGTPGHGELRQGIRAAVEEARSLVELLDKGAPKK